MAAFLDRLTASFDKEVIHYFAEMILIRSHYLGEVDGKILWMKTSISKSEKYKSKGTISYLYLSLLKLMMWFYFGRI